MDKKHILTMGIVLIIRNSVGEMATIGPNNSEFVVCRFHPSNSVYLSDAQLEGWYPSHKLKQLIYFLLGLITNR